MSTVVDVDNPRLKSLERVRSRGVTQRELIDAFTQLEYEEATAHQLAWGNTNWLGYKMTKYPSDLFLIAELIWDLQPSLVIETGTFYGGSALFYACVMDAIGHGKVVSIDITEHNRTYPVHPRVQYLLGKSSTDPKIVEEVAALCEFWKGHKLVILDSNHEAPHVAAELEVYAPMVSHGSWLIVEDTNLDGRPIQQQRHGPGTTDGPGPWTALEAWLPENPEFKLDERKGSRYLRSMSSFVRRQRI